MSGEPHWYRQEEALLARVRSVGGSSRVPNISGYDDLRELGRGGQGVVYRAIQRSTRRPVAVKLLLDGAFASDDARRRFEREVDLIASLRHANIVRLYDSGVTDEGHPFYVMECIEGVALDALLRRAVGPGSAEVPLDTRAAVGPAAAPAVSSIRANLTLFATICDAIQYAHQRGVIHRDLKPSNIRIDATGQPHVLDFGLAKSVAPSDDGERAAMTVSGHFMGSLPWSSPEQAQGAHSRVDVRSDVYSLGVILYQMVTGALPYPVTGPFHEVVQHILHTPPARPRGLRGDIDDDLETIILKCLEKDPERRYAGVGELVRDLRAYLVGEPIQAKRDRAWYTLRKRLHRYRMTATVAVVGLVIVAAFAAGSSLLYSRALRAERLADRRRVDAESAAAKATRITGALRGMLESLDPWRVGGRDPRLLRDMLADAAARLPVELAGYPDAQAEVRGTLASAYWGLGDFAAAREQYEAQRGIYLELHGADDPRTLVSGNHLGMMQLRLGESVEAEALLRDVLERSRRVQGPDHPDVLAAQSNYAYALHELGRVDAAAELHRATYEVRTAARGADDPETITTLNNYALCLRDLGRAAEAEPLLVETLERRRRVLGADHPDTAIACQNLAAVRDDHGDLEQAEALHRTALAIFEKRLGPEHESTSMARNNLASVLSRRGSYDEAETLLRAVLELYRRTLGDEHVQTLSAANNLANLLCEQGRVAEAEPLARQAADALTRSLGRDHPRTLTALSNLAMILSDLGQAGPAEALAREVLARRRQALPKCHPEVIVALSNLGSLRRDARDFEVALPLLEEALACARSTLAADHWMIGRVQNVLGHALALAGRFERAEVELRGSYDLLRQGLGEAHPFAATARQRLAQLYADWGKPERAAEFAAPSRAPTTRSSANPVP